MTRKIEKNNGTQVNSRTIGVLVHPDFHPATVTSFVVDLTYMGATIVPYVPDHTDLKTIEDSNGAVYYDSESTYTEDGVDYYEWTLYEGPQPDYPDSLLSTVAPADISANAVLYVLVDDGYTNSYEQYSTVKSVFNVNGDYCKVPGDGNQYAPVAGGTIGVISGNYFTNIQGNKLGYVASNDEVTDSNIVFSNPVVQANTSVKWSNSSYYYDLFTDTATPEVDDKAYLDYSLKEFYPQTIKSVSGDPEYYDNVNCVLSYSVDGSTFTELSDEAMTDANNVIANIPKYLYLKFSQDVEITEE